jgi:hypothetical protein
MAYPARDFSSSDHHIAVDDICDDVGRPRRAWRPRTSFLFVVGTSSALWAAIILAGWFLI